MYGVLERCLIPAIPLIQIKHKQKCKKRYLNQRPVCCKKLEKHLNYIDFF